jgi:hypothetical protein
MKIEELHGLVLKKETCGVDLAYRLSAGFGS